MSDPIIIDEAARRHIKRRVLMLFEAFDDRLWRFATGDGQTQPILTFPRDGLVTEYGRSFGPAMVYAFPVAEKSDPKCLLVIQEVTHIGFWHGADCSMSKLISDEVYRAVLRNPLGGLQDVRWDSEPRCEQQMGVDPWHVRWVDPYEVVTR